MISAMDAFCIDSCIIGCDDHLIVDDSGFSWSRFVPKETWHLSGTMKKDSERCFDTLLRLNRLTIDTLPLKKYVTMMATLTGDKPVKVPWSYVMPVVDHRTFVKRLVNDATVALGEASKDYYVSTWVPAGGVLQSLRPAHIDPVLLEKHCEESRAQARVLKTFAPAYANFAKTTSYDRFGSRTGRLTVVEGPDILTLKREFRDIITSQYLGGKVYYIDYAALEVRVLLYEAGMRCDDIDLYSMIARDVFSGSVERNAVKAAVIAELYGSSKKSLGTQLGISGRDLNEFVGKVKRHFRTDDLRKRVKDEFIKKGYITNHYGRRIEVDNPMDHILLNSYAQSTGVDVALLGFSALCERFKHLKGIVPLYVLHDALLIDCPPEHLDAVKEIDHIRVHGFVQKFFLKCEPIEH